MSTAMTVDPHVLARGADEPSNLEHHRPGVNVGQAERIASVAGGAVLALLGVRRASIGGLAIAGFGAALVHRGVTGNCAGYSALGIRTNHDKAEPEDYRTAGVHVSQSFSILKPRGELFAFWRNFENLPRFMHHLERVTVTGEKRSHWVAKAPAGRTVEWDAEIINEVPDELIAWRSLENADVDNAGSVRFLDGPAGRGTEVKVVIDYIPPAGRVGALVAKLFGEEPSIQVHEDLRRFKRLMETGEIPTIEGQPRGTCS